MIRLVKDARHVLPLLQHDPARYAFHLSLTESPYAELTVWAGWYDLAQRLHAAVAVLLPSEPCVLLAAGDSHGVQQILTHLPAPPPRVFSAVEPEHASALQTRYRWLHQRAMIRMLLDANRFRTADDARVVQLGPDDAAQITELFRHARRFSLDRFQLAQGHYYGVRDGGAIVSLAAAHFVSKKHRVAVVGNVVTHPDHRRCGLARACLGAVVQRLLPDVSTIVLTVDAASLGARALYRQVGFVEHSAFVEADGKLFSAHGKARPSVVRNRLAAVRSRAATPIS